MGGADPKTWGTGGHHLHALLPQSPLAKPDGGQLAGSAGGALGVGRGQADATRWAWTGDLAAALAKATPGDDSSVFVVGCTVHLVSSGSGWLLRATELAGA